MLGGFLSKPLRREAILQTENFLMETLQRGLGWCLLLGLILLSSCQNGSDTWQFSLRSHLQTNVVLKAPNETLVLFWVGNGCPIVQQSLPKMERLAREYGSRGVTFYWVNPNTNDTLEDVVAEAEEFSVERPILLDTSQDVTRHFGVTRTGEVLLINHQGRVLYRGAVDDRFDYGARRPVSQDYLVEALQAVLAKQSVKRPATEAKGCLIELSSP